jgi:transposase-like protein
MDFPIADLMDEDACYEFLVQILHPQGWACPRCQTHDGLKVHKRLRAPILDYRCMTCGRVFNAVTDTAFHKTSTPVNMRRSSNVTSLVTEDSHLRPGRLRWSCPPFSTLLSTAPRPRS